MKISDSQFCSTETSHPGRHVGSGCELNAGTEDCSSMTSLSEALVIDVHEQVNLAEKYIVTEREVSREYQFLKGHCPSFPVHTCIT